MTADEKTTLARFLDLAGDYLKDGYARAREECAFADDAPAGSSQPPESFSSLPLAYQVDEDEEARLDEDLHDIAGDINNCKACGLGASRTMAVPGEGALNPLVMVIGEGPGAEEDRTGRPFVGSAGQLLDRMLASIALSREKNCYITNMVKCRPPGNRDPEAGEIAACFPFLEQQIRLLRPALILCLGRVAAQSLLKTSQPLSALRGTFATLELNIPVLCTYHPSAILRDDSLRRPAWEDLKLLKSKLDSLHEE